MITMRFVNSVNERQAVYRLRYSIFVEEMGRPQRHANHLRKTIVDSLDVKGHILGAFDRGRIVGTGRLNFLRDGDIDFWHDLLDLRRVDDVDLSRVSLSTRLMVAQQFRGGTLSALVTSRMFQFLLQQNIAVDFACCKAALLGFFQKLGYLPYSAPTLHPDSGEVIPIRLNLLDIDHLELVRSPLRKVYRSFFDQPHSGLMPTAV